MESFLKLLRIYEVFAMLPAGGGAMFILDLKMICRATRSALGRATFFKTMQCFWGVSLMPAAGAATVWVCAPLALPEAGLLRLRMSKVLMRCLRPFGIPFGHDFRFAPIRSNGR